MLVLLALDVARQGRVGRDASATKRPGHLQRHALGHLEGEALVHSHVGGISTLSRGAVAVVMAHAFRESGTIGAAHALGTMLLEALVAHAASHAAQHHAAHRDVVPDLELTGRLLSHCPDDSSNFVARGQRVLVVAPIAVDGVKVRVAHATIDDVNCHILWARSRTSDLELGHLVLLVGSGQHEAALAIDDGSHVVKDAGVKRVGRGQ
mmetsp:Transcript_68614/g.143278  ORF Transcript_68614/g.143278 Transcript_68614/m.143278 type:complete len:208 (-) Transcript_68614:39-662(-)